MAAEDGMLYEALWYPACSVNRLQATAQPPPLRSSLSAQSMCND